MSRGPGKVERRVLQECVQTRYGEMTGGSGLAIQIDHERWLSDHGLTCTGLRDCCNDGPYAVDEPLDSTAESVRRAVRSLRRKGLVNTEWRCDGDSRSTYLAVKLTNEGRRTLQP
jgi:hypothetical protein